MITTISSRCIISHHLAEWHFVHARTCTHAHAHFNKITNQSNASTRTRARARTHTRTSAQAHCGSTDARTHTCTHACTSTPALFRSVYGLTELRIDDSCKMQQLPCAHHVAKWSLSHMGSGFTRVYKNPDVSLPTHPDFHPGISSKSVLPCERASFSLPIEV